QPIPIGIVRLAQLRPMCLRASDTRHNQIFLINKSILREIWLHVGNPSRALVSMPGHSVLDSYLAGPSFENPAYEGCTGILPRQDHTSAPWFALHSHFLNSPQ